MKIMDFHDLTRFWGNLSVDLVNQPPQVMCRPNVPECANVSFSVPARAQGESSPPRARCRKRYEQLV